MILFFCQKHPINGLGRFLDFSNYAHLVVRVCHMIVECWFSAVNQSGWMRSSWPLFCHCGSRNSDSKSRAESMDEIDSRNIIANNSEGGGRTKRRIVEVAQEGESHSSGASKKQRKKACVVTTTEGTANTPDHSEWFCGQCGLLESHDDSDLILCDGPCLRSFHIGCLDDQVIIYAHIL